MLEGWRALFSLSTLWAVLGIVSPDDDEYEVSRSVWISIICSSNGRTCHLSIPPFLATYIGCRVLQAGIDFLKNNELRHEKCVNACPSGCSASACSAAPASADHVIGPSTYSSKTFCLVHLNRTWYRQNLGLTEQSSRYFNKTHLLSPYRPTLRTLWNFHFTIDLSLWR